MDKIQQVLVQAGRKDLAKEYYKKVAGVDEIRAKMRKDNVKDQIETAKKAIEQLRYLIKSIFDGEKENELLNKCTSTYHLVDELSKNLNEEIDVLSTKSVSENMWVPNKRVK